MFSKFFDRKVQKNHGKLLEKVLKNFRKMLRNILQLMVKTGKKFQKFLKFFEI